MEEESVVLKKRRPQQFMFCECTGLLIHRQDISLELRVKWNLLMRSASHELCHRVVW